MSREIKNGGLAFTFAYEDELTRHVSHGMTLRDYFAAKAMQGLITDEYWARTSLETAKKAYRFADAMIEERGES
jgi:hypothetical protein